MVENYKNNLFNHYLKNREYDLWGTRLKLKGDKPEVQEVRSAIFSYSGNPDHLAYASYMPGDILDRCLTCIVSGFFTPTYTGYTENWR